jgi:hypothetical protein
MKTNKISNSRKNTKRQKKRSNSITEKVTHPKGMYERGGLIGLAVFTDKEWEKTAKDVEV